MKLMCKRLVLLLTLMITLPWLYACGSNRISDREMDIYEKIHGYYQKMERYSAELSFVCYSNKTENRYRATQKSIGHDKLFCRTVSDKSHIAVTTVVSGENTATMAEDKALFVALPNQDTQNLLFVSSFMKLYYGSESTALSVGGMANGNTTLLETSLSHTKSGVYRGVLAIDNKTLAPKNMTLYNKNGDVLVFCEYESFCYNDKTVTEDIFSVN